MNAIKQVYKWGKRLFALLLILLLIAIGLVLLVLEVPAVQHYAAQKAVNYVQTAFGIPLKIQKINLDFPKAISLKEVYLADDQSDTLLYCKRLHVDISLFSLLNNTVTAEELIAQKLIINVNRKDRKTDFNYQFIIDAFSIDTTAQIEDTTTVAPWKLSVKKIQLQEVALTYEDDSSGIKQCLSWKHINADLQLLELGNNTVRIKEITLRDVLSKTVLTSGLNNSENENSADTASIVSLKTGWDIAVDHLLLENNRIIYVDNTYPDTVNGFDPNHLDINDFKLRVDNIALNDSLIKASIDQFSCIDKSGLTINNFETELMFQEKGAASFNNLKLNTPHSKMALDVSFTYPVFNDLITLDQKVNLSFNLNKLQPGYKDLPLFLQEESIVDYKSLFDSLSISGKLAGAPASKLLLNELNIAIDDATQLAFSGELDHVTDIENLSFNIQLDSLVTTGDALSNKMPALILPQIDLPKSIVAKALIEGNTQNATTTLSLESTQGNIELDAYWQNDSVQTSNITGSLELKQYALGQLLPGFNLGSTGASLSYHLLVPANEDMSLQTQLIIDILEYSDRKFSNLTFEAKFEEEKLVAKGRSTNQILDFEINLNSELKEQQIHKLDLQLSKADLVQLGLSDSIMSLSSEIHLAANLSSIDDLSATLDLSNLQFLRANQLTTLDSLSFVLYQEKDSLFFKSENTLLDVFLYSNLNLGNIAPELLGYFDNYVDLGDYASDIIENDYLSLTVQTHESSVWQDLIIPELAHASPISFSMLYNQAAKHMEVGLQADSIQYNETTLDELNLSLLSDKENFNIEFENNKVSSGVFAFYKPVVALTFANDTANTNVSVQDSLGQANFVLNTQITIKDSSVNIHLNADTLLLSGEAWQVLPSNYIHIKKDEVTVNDFVLTNQEQKLSVHSIENKQDAFSISFEHFKLDNLLEIIGFTEKEVAGELGGDILLSQVFTNLKVETDISIDTFNIYEVPVGNIAIKAENATAEKYSFDVTLKGMGNDVAMQGDIWLGEDPQLDIATIINAIDLNTLEGLSAGELQEVAGYIEGNLTISGAARDPIVTGYLGFVGTEFLLSYLNITFSIDEQRVVFDPQSINFNDFIIRDINKGEAKVNGKILKNSLTDYTLDLKLNATSFKALDTQQGDNELYYGIVNINTDASVMGDIFAPKINMNLELLKGSDVTYIVPEDELLIEDQKGIIEFIQISEEDTLVIAIDTLVDNRLTGLDLNMNIEINDDTKLTVLIDETAGDKLEIEGIGDLVFGLQRNGNMTLTGKYEINDGFYLLTFYGLVKKQFALAEGSSVVWRGDPYNAALSIQTIYETRTSPQTLMTNAGSDGTPYKKPEVFQVLMNIRGELEKPQISFALDIPQTERSNASIYNTVRLLNQNEAELNKQVFALLVLNSFIATDSRNQDIGDNFISSTARSSVSQLLTQQLNNLSEKFIKGVQLDLNLDSYGNGSQAGTDLEVGISKSLLDDRITLEVGGSYQLEGEEQAGSNNLIGNVAIEYKITKDGRYSLRFYQMNDTNILDGQITSTGLSVIFTRDYDKLKNLFKKKLDETR